MHANAVTVVITTHNKAPFLREAVCSAAQQGSDTRIVIVDDASTDHSLSVAEQLARESPLVEVAPHTRNLGAAAARNTGLARVQTPWVVFLDGDDRLCPNAINAALTHAQTHGALLVSGWAQMFGAESKLWQPQRWDPYFIRYDNSIPACCLVKTELVRQATGYNEALPFAEDWDLWIRVSQANPVVFQMQQTFYEYRRGTPGGSHLSTYVDDQWDLTAPLMMVANPSLYNIEDLKYAVQQFLEKGAQWKDAIERHHARHPEAPLLQLLRAFLDEGAQRSQSAIERYAQLVGRDPTTQFPTTLLALWRLGLLLHQAGNGDAAYQILHQARIARPDMSFLVAPLLSL